ncbi:MAG: HEAT repeat domain-containing protein, partial [Phycisphaerae bacterium]|nr:HEAT repeat domain-containing protein [Phycisphaerae bacterium]
IGDVMRAGHIFLAACVCGLWAVSGCGRAATRDLTPRQQMELTTLAGQLADPARSAKTKLEAAELLLTSSYPQAVETLRDFLADSANSSAQIAIAEAIAAQGDSHEQFIKPLTAMLTSKAPAARAAAAYALTTYKDHGVTDCLVQIALDGWRDKPIRLDAVGALGRVLNKRAVDALVHLLDDPDNELRGAAAESLTRLTSIRSFGSDPAKWKQWWARNRNKKREQWLADLADNLARARTSLESENAQLRSRLAAAMLELYAATPAARRDELLLGFLRDPLSELRLVGAKLARNCIANSEPLSELHRAQIRDMLADGDDEVRLAAAMLVANLGDGEALKVLLDRLKVEEVPAVREALLTALGQLREVEAIPAVIDAVQSDSARIAAAAASALARIAAKQPLEEKQQTRAAEILIRRYRRNGGASAGTIALREALLTAMGVLGQKDFAPVLAEALKNPNATVRLAAVSGLAQLGQAEFATSLRGLVSDSDRGVRQAVIAALGALDGAGHLSIILSRTDPAAEPDAAVRRQAWDVAMAILARADAKTLSAVVNDLSERADAAAQRIEIMKMLIGVLKADKSADLPDVQRRLGLALMEAGRPAEAAVHLAGALELYRAAENAIATQVWAEWIDALLAVDDPVSLKAIAQQEDETALAEAVQRLQDRLDVLVKENNWAAAVLLAEEAIRQLSKQLTASQKTVIENVLSQAQAGRLQADRQKVAKLTLQLTAADEAARKTAAEQLQAMGDRAVAPLLGELKRAVTTEEGDVAAERAILNVLVQIAPDLTGYDTAASLVDRVKLIDSWLAGKS